MNAVSQYIMYVMNNMELFYNTHLHQVFVPTILLHDTPGLDPRICIYDYGDMLTGGGLWVCGHPITKPCH